MASKKEIEKAIVVKSKISRIFNVIVSIVSIICCMLFAFLFALKKIKLTTAGVLIPLCLMIYLLMGLLSLVGSKENRKSVMIIYIIAISLSGIVLFLSLIYASIH